MEMEEWMREERPTNMYRFLPLSGDEGSEVVCFLGPPRKTPSNFDPDKTEWHFDVRRLNYEEKTYEERTISETSDNFLAMVTSIVKEVGWNQFVRIDWVKQKSFKGRLFRNFKHTPLKLEDLVVQPDNVPSEA